MLVTGKFPTGTMNDLKISILRTFESTIKALIADGGMECVYDANARGSVDLSEICTELREIRTELSEIRTQLTQLEKRLEKKENEKNDECCSGAKKIANIVVNDVWPSADDIDDDIFRRSLLGQMPIPIRVPETTNAAPVVEAIAPITPELLPRAEETEENIPDITEIEEDEEVDNDNVEEDEEVEEEEEETALEEVEYKGMTYYKDDENLVYTLNDEGELNEDAVGRWYEDKKIVKFFAKPTQIRA